MKKMFLDGVVGWDFDNNSIRYALAAANGDDVEIEINSPGGLASEGFAIFHTLAQYSGTVTTIANGLVASSASIFFLAGDHRKVLGGARYMIHNASIAGMGTWNKEELTKMADSLRAWDESAERFYGQYTSIADPRQMMQNQKFYTDTEMLENGIASEIIDAKNTQAKEPEAMLKNIKAAIAKGAETPETPPVTPLFDGDSGLQMVAAAGAAQPAQANTEPADDNDSMKEVVATITDMANAMTKAVETMSNSVNAMTTEMSAVREYIKAMNTSTADPKPAEPAEPAAKDETTPPEPAEPTKTDEPTDEAKAQAAKEAAIEAREKAIEAREKLVAEKEGKIDSYFPSGDAVQQTNKWGGF